MQNLRILNIPLALLLALSFSGLQSLYAPCVAMAAPMACDVEAEPGDCGDANLQAGCCCLHESVETANMSFALVAERSAAPMVQVEQSVSTASSLALVAPLSRQAHARKSHPRLFQFHCCFLI